MQVAHSSSTSKDISAQSSSDYKLLITQQGNINGQEFSIENSEETNWLLYQFNTIPFLLYKYWLVLNFTGTLICGCFLAIAIYASYADLASLAFDDHKMYASLAVSYLFCLYGCLEMLIALNKRHSRIAQQSVVKFQYSLIGSIMAFIFLSQFDLKESLPPVLIYWSLSVIIHLVGGLAVLRAFKKNNPLARQSNLKEGDDENKDLLQQNGVIGSEVSKYDAQLDAWPYIIYRLWLKAIVIFEISFIAGFVLVKIMVLSMPQPNGNHKETHRIDVIPWIVLAILFSLNAYSCFKVEETMRTRNLAKSKKNLLLLKICSALSIIMYVIVGIYIYFGKQFQSSSETLFDSFLKWLIYIVAPPIVTLFGAIKANKIIEQRDRFVKFSSYTQSSYL